MSAAFQVHAGELFVHTGGGMLKFDIKICFEILVHLKPMELEEW